MRHLLGRAYGGFYSPTTVPIQTSGKRDSSSPKWAPRYHSLTGGILTRSNLSNAELEIAGRIAGLGTQNLRLLVVDTHMLQVDRVRCLYQPSIHGSQQHSPSPRSS
ncbi:unnamed protein product [Cuscuta europaea]|uniref:Uncharacterized protein n=1 Tax=Cuscuta europaea TaxID=41803 RepID=A0A9P0Z1I4_CUSEU|nr:unnamed protein product [Cuscuta europaea]